MAIACNPTGQPLPDAQRQAILSNPGFGRHFTDHMVTIAWTEARGWHDAVPKSLSKEETKLYIFNKLMDAGVATVYGSCFGKYFQNNLRFSYSTTNLQLIEEGINRIRKALNK